MLVLDKPLGMSSARAVDVVRRRAQFARTGHAGTLDPLATGVLVLALGRATKAIDQLMATDKRYETDIDLSAFTSTDDREGERREIAVAEPPTREAVERALAGFGGTILQRPPAFSAIHVGGRRAYDLARGATAPDEIPELAPRPVTVRALALLSYEWPVARVGIHCGKGFYVRSLARDLGTALGTGGHCATLCRTAVGPFTILEAHRIDALPETILPPGAEPGSPLLSLEAALGRVATS